MDKDMSKYNELVRDKFPQIVYRRLRFNWLKKDGEVTKIKKQIEQYKYRHGITEAINDVNENLEEIGLEKVPMDINKVIKAWKKVGVYSASNILETTIILRNDEGYGISLVDLIPYDELFADTHNGMTVAEYLDKKREDDLRNAIIHSGNYRSSGGKNASAAGRALVGGIIAGPVGAIVGAASAIDKNRKK